MLTQPHAAHRPHAVAGGVDGRRATPEVGVVVRHPALGAVVELRRLDAVLRQVLQQVEKRCGALGEVRDLGGPVVHLRVDVERVFAAPVGEQILAPATLEVARLTPLPAAGDRDVTAELEELRLQVRVGLTPLEGRHALLGRDGVVQAVAHIEVHPAHQAGEILDVRLPELLVILSLDSREHRLATRCGVRADILVVDVVGRDRQHEGHGIGARDHEAGIRRRERALLGQSHDVRLEAHAVAFDLRDQVEDARRQIAPGALHGQAVVNRADGAPEGAVKLCLHVHLPGLVGGDPHHHHVVGIGHKHLAGHLHAVLRVADLDDARLHVQLAVVVRDGFRGSGEFEQQVADRDVGLLVGGLAVEMRIHQFLGLLILLRVHQRLDLVVIIVGLGVVVVDRAAGPEGRLIERDALMLDPSEHIAAHVAVADEQAVQPHFAGRLVIPENHLPARFGHRLTTGYEHDQHRAGQG